MDAFLSLLWSAQQYRRAIDQGGGGCLTHQDRQIFKFKSN